MEPYEQLESAFVDWAENCEQMRAAILMGSRARNDGLADKWSDLDIITYCTDVELFVSNTDWVKNLGEVLVTHIFFSEYGRQYIVWVLFENGLNADFVIVDAKELEKATTNRDLKRGSRLLFDKDGLATAAKLVPSTFKIPDNIKPKSHTVENHIHGVLWRLVRVAKLIRRGHLFEALTDMAEVRSLLIRMMEWQTHLTKGWDIDVWYRGRYMNRWAAQELIDAYMKTYALCEEESIWQALVHAKEFAYKLTEDIVKGFEIDFPNITSTKINKMILQIRLS